MSRTIYDIDQAGTVICTYTDTDSEKQALKTVSQSSCIPAMASHDCL